LGSTSESSATPPGSGDSFPWNRIWKMECPNKVKIFSWRLVHNSLPLKRKIEAKGIELDTRCPVCWRVDEDACHLLFKCKFSKLVWRELQLDQVRMHLVDLPSPKEVFHYIWGCTTELQVNLITLMWVLTSRWLYPLFPSTSSSSLALPAGAMPYTLWHRRLNHLGFEALSRLVPSCNKLELETLCHACHLSHHVRLPFSTLR
jgi:hypothetical protein